MAARWGAADETLSAGTAEYFSAFGPDQGVFTGNVSDDLSLNHHLDAGETLDSLHACLDSSILSIFEDPAVTGEGKGRIDDESEASLLTALTEILDNVDGENLSPFDTLPDPEFFSGQKGRETSPLRRLLNLTRSPPEKEPVCIPKTASPSSGKAARPLSRPLNAPLQRSDGEEEDDLELSSLVQGSEGETLFPSLDMMELDNLLTAEQASDHITTMSLGDLVKHMHPYCLAVSLELDDADGEAVLPEGGIVLEVVDRGEQGEPILAVAATLPGNAVLPVRQQATSAEAEIPGAKALEEQGPGFGPVAEEEDGEASEERPKQPMLKKSLSRRRKKRKSKASAATAKKQVPGSEPAARVAESPVPKDAALQPVESSRVTRKKKKVTFAPVLASVLNTSVEDPAPPTNSESPAGSEDVALEQPVSRIQREVESAPGVPSSFVGPVSDSQPADARQELAAPQQEGAKPKSLSLQQYRLLRQQKKLAPVERPEGGGTKWPSLPEPPKELPPIPCLLERKALQDPRRATAHVTSRAMPDNASVWQPKGSRVPPTPEALLVPPMSVVVRSKPSVVPAPVSKPAGAPQPVQSKPVGNPAVESPPHSSPPAVSPAAPPQNAAPVTPAVQSAHPPEQHPGCSPEFSSVHPEQPAKLLPTEPRRLPVTPTATNAPRWQHPEPPAQKKAPVLVEDAPPASRTASQPEIRVQPDPAANTPAQRRPQRAPQQNILVRPAEKSPMEKLVRSFTSEIGIEASDLTSLLEQFEETQAKEEHTVPEVCAKAAAVGNSGKPAERAIFPELASTAGLTPPATPPHQTWKPLAPVALLGKPKPSPSKAIQIINPRPLPPSKIRGKTLPPAAFGAPARLPMFVDHDYCLPPEGQAANEQDPSSDAKQQQQQQASAAVLQPLGGNTAPQHSATVGLTSQPLDHRTQPEAKGTIDGSVLLSPDTSPCRTEANPAPSEDEQDRSRGTLCVLERSASPPVQERGRTRRRYRARSPRSSSSSSGSGSRSCSSSGSQSRSRSSSRSSSPPRKRFRSRSRSCHSASSSSFSSRSSSGSPSCSPPRRRQGSYSSSRSGSWSRSRSRSPRWHGRSRSRSRSPRWRGRSRSPSCRRNHCYESRERLQNQEAKDRKLKAIEERRVVYVGRIRGGMTRKELKERFSLYGEIEDCTLHFREHGDNYGFVTYYKTKDAFDAIEHGSKLRQCNELPFDLCFGGRRQFCKSTYADLDSSREYEPAPAKSKFGALDFDTLLKQAQKSLKR
ncbi:peroxisome proliferator-activated receptor gamma coactivator-related protein 1 [Scleropages formosus]|uniref:PPARG related coactivator 1 n=1 Tax=Scleropages formosus TaxID=113540 RepID=A0A8C9V6J4_SCLFO|nr:peroxisome proliferator-activated receptor gamma coactivator-related protein 1 [Scleropages formosus]